MKIVDLFSGVGGLTFGFYYRKRGNQFVRNRKNQFIFANEFSDSAARAFKSNFPDIPMIHEDISNIDKKYLDTYGLIDDIDLVLGGPPCQSFSMVGKRQYDKRAKMYKEYIRLLSILKPKMFIFENVVGLLTMKNDRGNPVINDIMKMFQNIPKNKDLGYRIEQKTLNSQNYGVPQSRERVFLIGIRNDLDNRYWRFPVETHGNNGKHYLTVKDAISDLPHLEAGESCTEYSIPAQSNYQILMRGNNICLMNHCAGINGEKINTVIKNIEQGQGKEDFNKLVETGILDEKYYLTSGYKNTYARLWWDRPATTLTNSFGTPSSLRCIHPQEDRALSTREGARIQSFPDWFVFLGNKYERNSQIGNAVPPLLALALSKSVDECFKKWEQNNEQG